MSLLLCCAGVDAIGFDDPNVAGLILNRYEKRLLLLNTFHWCAFVGVFYSRSCTYDFLQNVGECVLETEKGLDVKLYIKSTK